MIHGRRDPLTREDRLSNGTEFDRGAVTELVHAVEPEVPIDRTVVTLQVRPLTINKVRATVTGITIEIETVVEAPIDTTLIPPVVLTASTIVNAEVAVDLNRIRFQLLLPTLRPISIVLTVIATIPATAAPTVEADPSLARL